MGLSSTQLKVLKKCTMTVFNKWPSLKSDRDTKKMSTGRKLPVEANNSKEKHRNLLAGNQSACDLVTRPDITTKRPISRLPKLSQACQSVPYIHIEQDDDSNNGSKEDLKTEQYYYNEENKPAYASTPVTPVQTLFANNNDTEQQFNWGSDKSLSYYKSTSSLNSSCSEEEEAITPSNASTGQWLSADLSLESISSSSSKKTRRSKSQGNRAMVLMDVQVDNRKASMDDVVTYVATAPPDTRKSDLDRSPSVGSSTSSISLNSATTSKSIFGKSEFHRKESKAIRMWHTTVEKLILQRRVALSFEKRDMRKYTEKDLAIAKFIIGELYSTEKSYHQFLMFVRSNYMEPMQIASQSKNPLVKPSDVHVLFYHLPDLIAMSERLLYRLELYINDPGSTSPGLAVGQIFKDMEEDFAVFLRYAVHYQGHMKAIRRASNTGYVIKIDRESRNNRKENNRLGLADYLIAPFQRVPRYELLLNDLLKHTDTSRNNNNNNNNITTATTTTTTSTTTTTTTTTHDLILAKNIINGLASTMNMVQEKISKSLFTSSFYSFTAQSTSNLTSLQQV